MGSGLLVTNAHVVEGTSRIEVNTLDGRTLQADLLGLDHDADLAVLKVDARDLPAVPLGSAEDLLIGETVIAIGNPFGLSHSVATGVVSARGRARRPAAGRPAGSVPLQPGIPAVGERDFSRGRTVA
ncbi:MAG: S1C family serine protease [Thermoanaerobaculia bacterium]